MSEQFNKYTADLNIDVKNQFIKAELTFSYYCNIKSTKELRFYIHKDLIIENVSSKNQITCVVEEEVSDWCPFVLESKLIKITLDKPVKLGDRVDLCFRYKGHINLVTKYGINRISDRWIELGIYTPWFPVIGTLENALFNISIKIDDGYLVVNSNKVGDSFILNQPSPDMDSTIIASNQFYHIENKIHDTDMNVYVIEEAHKTLAEDISRYSNLILSKYASFGRIDSNSISIVIVPREDGGGYCRSNLIVLTPNDNLNDESRYFKYIAHELAHLWWCKSTVNSWEDWLNESFAEYSALLVLRDIFGENEFNKRINIYKEKSEGLPPIIGIDRGNEKAYEVLYIKGPLLLYELEKRIGQEKFIELFNTIHLSNIDNTEKFLAKLGNITNENIRNNFEKQLSL